ncbi:Prefoldin beta-like [Arabidopsis thaliana x Arabidopsis arenosa]|uniref:Prefoldin beta-like n=1 Tax=Arabidopsis thaliana x Arabidopsis arenosa TaxID=1240361 RepID=A0A8T2C8Z0_9BRAS|nr:Prefoldin beta-like [Arabidopsis thaliana x Arabidopsis arenosa]
MATTTSSSSSGREFELEKEIKRQEVSLDELSSLSSSRRVYQKNGNLFFLTSTEKAKTSAQKQLDYAKSEINKIRSQT